MILPASCLQSAPKSHVVITLRFWGIAWIGNMLGAFVLDVVIAFAQTYTDSVQQSLDVVVAKKMAYQDEGTVSAWLRIIVSGMMGNGLIGMAAFLPLWQTH